MEDSIERKREGSALMLFDGICVFCSRSVQFIANRSVKGKIEFCPMQAKKGQNILSELKLPTDNYESLVVIYKGDAYFKSNAIIILLKSMSGNWSVVAKVLFLFPRVFLDYGYDFLARYRYKILGKNEVCYIPNKVN